MKTGSLGIDEVMVVEISEKLNDLLANFQVYYQNLRGFHWNIKGRDFFELHIKFEELYNLAAVSIDEIAERILTLDHIPMHTYSNYIKVSDIEEATNVTNGREAMGMVKANIEVLLKKEKSLLKLAESSDDQGTADLMTQYITAQEKLMWMLRSYLA
ncbi:MAG: DNA starvation/stationary phase protection protein [Bacteroidetes bacterium]|nr:DNA starvation/stationary phase protection protein [Bacteroidota bacterium]